MNDLFIREVYCDLNEIDEDEFYHDIVTISNLKHLTFKKNITFFVGENQSGKSTLLEAIALAYGFNPEGGTINYNFQTFDEVSSLSNALKLIKGIHRPHISYFFRAETFFNVASKTEDYRDLIEEDYYRYYGGKSFHKQSHGESFYSYITAFKDRGLYILDEPEAALSPQKQLSLLLYLHQMAQSGSQFIIATHSPILLGLPDCEILSFDDGTIHPIKYEECECVKVYDLFINHKDQLLFQLLDKEE